MGFLKKLFGKKDHPQKKQTTPSPGIADKHNNQTPALPKTDKQPRKKTAEILWINALNDAGSEYFSSKFWTDQKIELIKGTFWADEIKNLKDNPLEKLALSLKNLPLPGAFTHAAIAIRALIRNKRKAKENYEKELHLLYWLAAINSFSIPYSKVLEEPGNNVLFSVPGEKISSLSFEYQKLGYKKLELLNKTDVKWMLGSWGEPQIHTTLHTLHIDVWVHYENKLKTKNEKKVQDLMNYIEKA